MSVGWEAGPCDLMDHLGGAQSCPECHGSPAAEVASLQAIAPELVAAELRPLLKSLRSRVRNCARCGRAHIQKRFHASEAAYCQDSCRKAAWRERDANTANVVPESVSP